MIITAIRDDDTFGDNGYFLAGEYFDPIWYRADTPQAALAAFLKSKGAIYNADNIELKIKEEM